MNSQRIEEMERIAAVPRVDAWSGALVPLRRLYALVIAVLVLFWSSVVIILVVTFALTAWGDRRTSHAPAATSAIATESPRPPGVPASAQIVERDLVLGDVSDFIYFFAYSDCVDGVVTITTTKATVYAEAPCAEEISQNAVRRLLGQPVRIRIGGGRVLLEALFVGVFEFNADRVWVEQR